jgi:hypothetical protein
MAGPAVMAKAPDPGIDRSRIVGAGTRAVVLPRIGYRLGEGRRDAATARHMLVKNLIERHAADFALDRAGARRAVGVARTMTTKRDRYPIEPMTLGNMRHHGVRGLDVTCPNCRHASRLEPVLVAAALIVGCRRGRRR